MEESEVISQNLHMLCDATSTEQELEALRLLNLHLANIHATSDADFIERQYLTQSKTVLEEGNPYPLFQVTQFCFSKTLSLKDWVNYIFVRRYGWSEVMPTGATLTVQRIIGVGSSSKNEAAMKSDLNELLDEFLKWLLCQKLSHELIFSFQYTVQQAMNHPVIRKQTYIHILEWFRSSTTVFHEEFFKPSKELIILGLTDVWSAIRSACSSKLNAIAEQFNIKQLEMFFLTLVQICRDTGSSWQAKEGAVMGLNVIVRRFQWVGSGDETTSVADVQSDQQKVEFRLKFGTQSLQRIPEFISATLHDVIFLLLSDPQLSIREHAIKTFSSYLSRCDFQEAMSSFNEVISALCKGASLSQEEMLQFTDISQLVMSPNLCWMNAYLAEGLLGLCIFLVKHIPPDHLLPSWALCMNTLSLYLTHPASTVRQATSKVIKFLVAKDTSNPAILKLVLSSLSSSWKVDLSSLSQSCLPENWRNLPESTQVYMRTNRIHNPSITSLPTSPAEKGTAVSKTWEWREGRLLAYELVFQFLIKNHWLYTFGTSGAIKPHSNSYYDEHKRSHSPANTDLLRPLQSYGGITMQSVKSPSNATVNGTYNRSFNLREPPHPSLIIHSESSGSLDRKFQRSSDAPREAMLRPRRATLDHQNLMAKLNPTSRHYPYGDKCKSSSRLGDGVNITAMPLITAVKHLERSQTEEKSSSFSQNADEIIDSLPVPDQPSNKQAAEGAVSENERRRLMTLSKESSMSELLMNILHQAVECVNSGSWELRRMSQQVLPCLMEIMRWYDMSLLVKYWAENLSTHTTVNSYGASLSFLYSVSHAAKLYPLLIDPPDNWLDLQVCKNEVKKIIDCMVTQLSIYIPTFLQILKRPTLDKLSIIAVQVLLTSASFINSSAFPTPPTAATAVTDAVDCIKLITILNHPTGRIQKYRPPVVSNRILLPGSGFLSCNSLDSDQLSVNSQKLLKYLLEHVHCLLVGFLKLSEVKSTYTLLPCLVKFLRSQYSALHVNRAFSDSVLIILDKLSSLQADPLDEKLDMLIRKKVYETKNDCFYELILCITDKTIDKHVLHMALDCLHGLLQHADSCRYILPLCKATCSQLSANQGASNPSRTCTDDLEILSNDIREYSEQELADDSESEDEESVLLELDHQESLALHNSGGTTGSGRQSALSQRSMGELSGKMSMHSDADSGSDWDSWDEEEEESNDKESVFQEFLQKIYQIFQNQGRLDEFHAALKKLSQSEYRLLKSILKI